MKLKSNFPFPDFWLDNQIISSMKIGFSQTKSSNYFQVIHIGNGCISTVQINPNSEPEIEESQTSVVPCFGFDCNGLCYLIGKVGRQKTDHSSQPQNLSLIISTLLLCCFHRFYLLWDFSFQFICTICSCKSLYFRGKFLRKVSI